MAQVVFLWASNFRKIDNVGINFGSEHIFSVVELNGKYQLKKKPNEQFVSKFFDSEQNRISNVTAIVGENASGKSSILSILQYAYALETININDDNKIKYVIVFSDNDKLYVNYSNNYYNNIKLEYDEADILKKEPDGNCIFYAPSYDFALEHNEWQYKNKIDVSSDFLLFTDVENTTFNQYDAHKLADIERQVILVKDPSFQNLNGIIVLPEYLDIRFSDMSGAQKHRYRDLPKNDHGVASFPDGCSVSKHFKNSRIPELIRPNLANLLNNSRIDGKRLELKKQDDKKTILKFDFLHYLINNLCYYFDMYEFEKSEYNSTDNRDSDTPITDDKTLCKETVFSEISKFGREDYNLDVLVNDFDRFVNEQGIINGKVICEFREATFNAIDNSCKIGDSNFTIKFDSPYFDNLFDAYRNYLTELSPKSLLKYSFSFIDFSWRGISTGERAFLNLYSRLFSAKHRINSSYIHHNDILLLIDEGELGFHIQWQKEYIYNLLKVLPIIFTFEDGVKPNIQIIFTTHSPVTLSDIPKTNVVYLKDCKIDDSVDAKCFAGNIHSIMKHSFFMKEGFVGEFAKEKLNKIIKDISNNETEIPTEQVDKYKKVINMIDEPILREELEHLLSKRIPAKVSLQRKKEYLQEQIDQIDDELQNL